MFECPARSGENRPSDKFASEARTRRATACRRFLAALTGLIFLAQPACLFKKHKAAAPQAPPPAVRIVYLPLNVSGEDAKIRWVALAVPVMMAKASEEAPDLDMVPMWEAMPLAIEAAGTSRIITPEVAAYIASRLTAKWAAEGELSPTKRGVKVTVDFIPVKTTLVPFRYEKESSIDSLGGHFTDAIAQLLRYLVLRPMPRYESETAPQPLDVDTLKEIVEALDREYGWFTTADPGKSDKVVADLTHSDNRLARLLFNPSLYPGIGSPTPSPKPDTPAAAPEKSDAARLQPHNDAATSGR